MFVNQDKRPLIWVALILILLALLCLSIMIGRYPIGFFDLFRILFSRIAPLARTWPVTMEKVVFDIRLPRILMAALAGCSLAVAGSAYQGVFQNPMASPDILGASNGAAFGAALAILWGLSLEGIVLFSFTCSLVAVVMVYLLSRRLHTRRTTGLILCGIMVGSLLSAGTSFIKLVADPTNELPAITYWLMGSLSGVTWKTLLHTFLPLMLGVVPLLLIRWKIDLLSLGDEEARVLGMNVDLLRKMVIFCSTLATSAVIANCGLIGWVGLVVPHLARRLVGSSNRRVLPASALMGASFLVLVDDVSRNLLSSEIPIGILTAFIGAPFFLSLMLSKESHQ
ncbi:MAG: iron ABC transporter permease [Sphaerochaetaceae bacterium]